MSVSLLPKGMRVPSPPKAAHDGPPEAAYYHGFCSRTLASSALRLQARDGRKKARGLSMLMRPQTGLLRATLASAAAPHATTAPTSPWD